MSRHLASKESHLDAIFSSTAKRAWELADAIGERLGVPVHANKELYTFSSSGLLEAIRSLPPELTSIAVVAHNPAITNLANRVLGLDLQNIPTSGVVAIDSKAAHWHELGQTGSACAMDYFDYPKLLY
jgi:phosphohistidine phosphatase